MVEALFESVMVAVMLSAGLFLLAAIAALADLWIGRPETVRPDPVEPCDFREALGPAYKAVKDGDRYGTR